METVRIDTGSLDMNTGQVKGLPTNPRQWTKKDVSKLAASIKETPELFDMRPCIVYPHAGRYVVLGGNMRLAASMHNKAKTVPCVVVPEDMPLRKLKEIVIKDNGSFGDYDWDVMANEWDDLPLTDWGVPAWDPDKEVQHQMSNGGLTTEGAEGDDEYNEFVDKFKQKLTTDDCYTPTVVYDAVLEFVGGMTDLKGRKVVRPFYPGGDYERLDQYPDGCIVVDNPPFSIMSAILRYYCAHDIQFFLFAPSLTLFSAPDCDLTYVIADADIVYDNGANVRTGFITNIPSDLRIWCCPELGRAIADAQETEDKTKRGFVYPDNIVTAATLGKLAAHATELRIRKASCEFIKTSDSAEAQGRSLFGGGFILSDRAAAERAAAERAAAERAAATRLNLSEREREIIARLNERDTE